MVTRKSEDQLIAELSEKPKPGGVAFKKTYIKLKKLFGVKGGLDYKQSKSQELVLRAFQSSLLSAISIAEEKYKSEKTEGSSYAYTNMLNISMSIMQELASLHSIERQVDYVCDDLIYGNQNKLLQNILQGLQPLRRDEVINKNPVAAKQLKVLLDSFLSNVSEYMDESREQLSEQIHAELIGDPAKPSKRKVKNPRRSK